MDLSTKSLLPSRRLSLFGQGAPPRDLLWDLTSKLTPKEAAPRLCAQLRLPQTEEKFKEVEHQLQRTLQSFRDAGTGAPTVYIVLQVPLGSGEYMLVDKVAWDLNKPRLCTELYAAKLCRDMGLGWCEFAAVAQAIKAKDLKSGGSHVHIVPPQENVLRKAPASYPVILRAKRLRTCGPGSSTRDRAQPISAMPSVHQAPPSSHSNPSAAGMAAASEPGSATATREAAIASIDAVDAASVGPAAQPPAPPGLTSGESEATANSAAARAVRLQVEHPAAASAARLQVEQVQQQSLDGEEQADQVGKMGKKVVEEDEGSDMPDLGFA
ncbi:hypothetical protein N2152v2_004575 [Parachlorella kessleri]